VAPKKKTAQRKKILNLVLCFMKTKVNIKNIKVAKQRIENGILMYAAVIIPKEKAMHKPTNGYLIYSFFVR
jgi:hypothetical protein